jgi:hypothetical protein
VSYSLRTSVSSLGFHARKDCATPELVRCAQSGPVGNAETHPFGKAETACLPPLPRSPINPHSPSRCWMVVTRNSRNSLRRRAVTRERREWRSRACLEPSLCPRRSGWQSTTSSRSQLPMREPPCFSPERDGPRPLHSGPESWRLGRLLGKRPDRRQA